MTHNFLPDNRVCMIAGEGYLPRHIYAGCKRRGLEVHVIGIKDCFDRDAIPDATSVEIMPAYALTKIIRHLRDEKKIPRVVFAGRVKRSFFTRIIPKLLLDPLGRKFMLRLMKGYMSDDNIFTNVLQILEENGITILKSEELAPDILMPKGNITNLSPSKEQMPDIMHGIKVLDTIAQYDIGQSIVVDSGLVLGIEAVEGTDSLIDRCGIITKENNLSPVFVKICKAHQDKRVDLPCIGSTTVKKVHANGILGIAVSAGSTLIVDPEESIRLANKLGIFIYGI